MRLPVETGSQPSRRAGNQDGFTLVELLVAMLVGIVVIGSGTWGIALAFRQSTGATNRVQASRSAEVGLEALVRDLRQAVSCPSATTAGVTSYPLDPAGNSVSGVYVSSAVSNLLSIDMCDPAPGLPSQATTTNSNQIAADISAPSTVLVSWACNLGSSPTTPTGWASQVGAETCQRTWASINTTSLLLGTASLSTSFRGVTGLALSGVLGSTTGTQALSCPTGCSYVLSSGATNSLSWLGFDATVATLQNPSVATSTVTVPGTSPVTLRSGAALENYGT